MKQSWLQTCYTSTEVMIEDMSNFIDVFRLLLEDFKEDFVSEQLESLIGG